MNRVLACVFFVLAVVGSSNAFTVAPSATVTRTTSRTTSSSPVVLEPTALDMVRVKVDPNKQDERFSKADMKMAAYGGSIVIALALPLVFLVWSAVSK